MNTAEDQLRLATVGHEMTVSMEVHWGSIVSDTTAYLVIDTGSGRCEHTLVHNVPEKTLDRVRVEGKNFRQIIIENGEGGIVLKRIVLGGTEYYLTVTS